MSFETECSSMVSLMSKRSRLDSEPNRNSASALASSVLPVPVGPAKRSTAVGLLGSFIPERATRTASATALIACAWPFTRSSSVASMRSSLSRSSPASCATGSLQRSATAAATSSRSMAFLFACGFAADFENERSIAIAHA